MPSLPTGTVTSSLSPLAETQRNGPVMTAAGQQRPCQPGISQKCSHEYAYVFA